jgi:hypothetical protein
MHANHSRPAVCGWRTARLVEIGLLAEPEHVGGRRMSPDGSLAKQTILITIGWTKHQTKAPSGLRSTIKSVPTGRGPYSTRSDSSRSANKYVFFFRGEKE